MERKLIDELVKYPYLDRASLSVILGKDGPNLNYWIKSLTKQGLIEPLRAGLYASKPFLLSLEISNGELYSYYIANLLCYPSYVSMEYALSVYGLIPEGVFAMTSVTTKSSRRYQTPLGAFLYRSIKEELYTGFTLEPFLDKKVRIATPAKALFDFIYFQSRFISEVYDNWIEELRINWGNLSAQRFEEFIGYIKKLGTQKMKRGEKLFYGFRES